MSLLGLSPIWIALARSICQLEDAIRTYLKLNNADPKPFIWTKSTDESWPASNASVYEFLTQDTRDG